MNTRRTFQWLGITAMAGVVLWVSLRPRTHPLPGGYTDAFFPSNGHRYLIAPGGIKKVGPEVLTYQVAGTVVTGTVRSRLDHDEVRTFRLDLKTHELTLGDQVRNPGH